MGPPERPAGPVPGRGARPGRPRPVAGGLAAGGLPPALTAYGLHWEFNGPLYEPLWRLLAAAGAAPALARGLELFEHRTGEFERWDWLYRYLYPQLLAKLALAGGALAAVLLALRDRDTVAGTGRLFSRLLLCAATLYPWYLLWVLPWAALVRHPAWLALSGTVLLSYLAEAGVPLWPWVHLAIWGPFFVLLTVGWRRKRGWSSG